MSTLDQIQRDNQALQKQIDDLLRKQELQKKRIADYLSQSFAETNALKEEMRTLQNQASELFKELSLLKPAVSAKGNFVFHIPSISKLLFVLTFTLTSHRVRRNSSNKKQMIK